MRNFGSGLYAPLFGNLTARIFKLRKVAWIKRFSCELVQMYNILRKKICFGLEHKVLFSHSAEFYRKYDRKNAFGCDFFSAQYIKLDLQCTEFEVWDTRCVQTWILSYAMPLLELEDLTLEKTCYVTMKLSRYFTRFIDVPAACACAAPRDILTRVPSGNSHRQRKEKKIIFFFNHCSIAP